MILLGNSMLLDRQPDKKFYLSAAPRCPTEPKIYYLEKAIKTSLFDYVFVQFYNNLGCSYTGDIVPLIDSRDKWASMLLPNKTHCSWDCQHRILVLGLVT